MALAKVSRAFGVNDVGMFKLSTDPPGAPPTYAAKVDVPGAKSIEVTLETDTKELRGDNTLLGAAGRTALGPCRPGLVPDPRRRDSCRKHLTSEAGRGVIWLRNP